MKELIFIVSLGINLLIAVFILYTSCLVVGKRAVRMCSAKNCVDKFRKIHKKLFALESLFE